MPQLRRFQPVLLTFTLASLFLLLILSFQNCARPQKQDLKSESARFPIVVVDQDYFDFPLSESDVAKTRVGLDPAVCLRSYISIFSWRAERNPSGKFEMSSEGDKLATIELGKSAQEPQPGFGWTISGYLIPHGDRLAMGLWIEKSSINLADQMDCYFSDDAVLNQLSNAGTKDSPKGFVGFLKNRERVVACRVLNSVGTVRFVGADGNSFTLPGSRPFIVKRGCFQ